MMKESVAEMMKESVAEVGECSECFDPLKKKHLVWEGKNFCSQVCIDDWKASLNPIEDDD